MVAAKVFRRSFEEKLGFDLRVAMANRRSRWSHINDDWDYFAGIISEELEAIEQMATKEMPWELVEPTLFNMHHNILSSMGLLPLEVFMNDPRAKVLHTHFDKVRNELEAIYGAE